MPAYRQLADFHLSRYAMYLSYARKGGRRQVFARRRAKHHLYKYRVIQRLLR